MKPVAKEVDDVESVVAELVKEVSWKTITTLFACLLALVCWLGKNAYAKLDGAVSEISTVKERIARVETQYGSIKEDLVDIKTMLRRMKK